MDQSGSELQSGLLEIAEHVTRRLLDERKDVLAVYVYGSVARGAPTPLSDLDLHVVLDRTDWPDPDHEKTFYERTQVDLSYHGRVMYDPPLRAWSPTAEAIEAASWTEGLWEFRQIKVLYDPSNMLPAAQKEACAITEHPLVIQRRVAHTREQLKRMTEYVRNALAEKNPVPAYCGLYQLTGGGGARSGVVPLLARTVIQAANLPLTARRYLARLREALEKLRRRDLFDSFAGLFGVSAGSGDWEKKKDSINALFDAVEAAAEENSLKMDKYPLLQELIGIRQKCLALFDDLLRCAGPETACACVTGYSTTFFTDDHMNERPWLPSLTRESQEKMLGAAASLAGVSGDIDVMLRKRLSEAEAIQAIVETMLK